MHPETKIVKSTFLIVKSAAATQTVGKAMKTATGAMQAVGKAVDPKKLHQTMMEFAKENEKQDFAMDLMDDAIETVMDTEETEEETTDLMNEVDLSTRLLCCGVAWQLCNFQVWLVEFHFLSTMCSDFFNKTV